VISQYVLDEAAAGNPVLAEERMAQRGLWPRSRAAGYAEQGILILDLKHMTSRI
jgi:hypothetical protein